MLDYQLTILDNMHIHDDNGLPADLKCTQLTLGIRMLKISSFLHSKCYHMTLVN